MPYSYMILIWVLDNRDVYRSICVGNICNFFIINLVLYELFGYYSKMIKQKFEQLSEHYIRGYSVSDIVALK